MVDDVTVKLTNDDYSFRIQADIDEAVDVTFYLDYSTNTGTNWSSFITASTTLLITGDGVDNVVTLEGDQISLDLDEDDTITFRLRYRRTAGGSLTNPTIHPHDNYGLALLVTGLSLIHISEPTRPY